MGLNDCIKFANENPVCFLATCDGDQPRVRCMGFWFADETGFYFQTGEIKEMVGQMRRNKKIEVCFYKSGENAGQTLRIAGPVEFLDDINLKKKVMVQRPFLKSFGMDYDSPGLIIFRIARGTALFWNMAVNLKQKEYIHFGTK